VVQVTQAIMAPVVLVVQEVTLVTPELQVTLETLVLMVLVALEVQLVQPVMRATQAQQATQEELAEGAAALVVLDIR